jgi:hypothetical protein
MRVLLGLLCSCRPHCQHRYGGLAHDAFGDTAQHQVLEPSPAMCRHNHKIRSEPLPRGNDQIAGLSSFDCQLTLNPCRYTLGTLFEPGACGVNLGIVKVLAGESFGRSLGGQRIYLHDVQQMVPPEFAASAAACARASAEFGSKSTGHSILLYGKGKPAPPMPITRN